MTTLSICILTYNRAAFLPELLDSIIAQNEADVEVILSDDASSDDTPAVAASYAKRMRNFRYVRHEQNLGLDKNFLAAVAAASGDYAWLMGDDDRIEPGGIARIIAALKEWPDVGGLTVGVNDYDVTMTNVIAVREMPDTQLIHGAAATLTKLADLIGFMSAMVVRRDAWVAIAKDPVVTDFHNLYVHVYMMGRIVRQVGTWGVIQQPCVGFRTGNDQFLSKTNWKRRLAIDVLGYDQIAKGILSDDAGAQRAMRRRIFNTHIMSRVRTSKDIPGGDEGSLKTAGFLFRYYRDIPEFWSKGLPRALAPSWLIRASRAAYQGAKQKLG